MALLGTTIESGLGSGGGSSRARQAHSVKRSNLPEKHSFEERGCYYACQCRMSLDRYCPDHLDGPATIHQYREKRKNKLKTQQPLARDTIIKDRPTKIIKSAQTSGATQKKLGQKSSFATA